MRRPTTVRNLPSLAMCQVCGWTKDAPNALALAAIHHDRTGHIVMTQVTRIVTYGEERPGECVDGRGALC